MRKVIFTIWASFFIALFATAQKARFEFYNNQKGLSDNRIWSITQDSLGFIWVLTDGLNRFDGLQFLHYSNQNASIFKKQTEQSKAFVNHQNVILINSKKVTAYNTLNGHEINHPLDKIIEDNDKLNPGSIELLPNGDIIIPISNVQKKHVEFYRFKNKKFELVTTVNNIAINYDVSTLIYSGDAHGNLYFPSSNLDAIIKINNKGEKISEFQINLNNTWYKLKSGTNNSLLVSLTNKFFILKENSTSFEAHPINEQLTEYNQYINDFIEMPNGDIWACATERSLIYYESDSGKIIDYRNELQEIIPNRLDLLGLFKDKNRNIWVRTIMGLIKVNPQESLFETYFTKPLDNCGGYCSFRGFTEDNDGNIYAGYYSSIFQINPETKETAQPFKDLNYPPFDLEFEDGHILLNNGTRINPTTQETDNLYMSENTPMDIGIYTRDKNNDLWWAWSNMLFFLDKKENPFKWKKINKIKLSKAINDIKFDKLNNKLWLASENKIIGYKNDETELEIFDKNDLQSTLSVRYIHLDPSGILWLACESGLVRFDPKAKSVKKYTKDDGLSNNYVIGILPEGDSCLWLSTNFGLSRFSIATESFINFYEEDGLPHNEFNRRSFYNAKNGQFFFGGLRGIAAFFPEEIMKKYEVRQSDSKVVLTSFIKTIGENDSISTTLFHNKEPAIALFYKNKSYTFEYALTEFHNSDKVLYSYRMEGHNDVWSVPSKNNTANFGNLTAGKYTFVVKALNAKGVWNPNPLKVHLLINPPWWKTGWAYSTYVLLIVGMLYGIFRFLIHRFQLQSQLTYEKKEANRLKDLDKFKNRLYTNLTHEFRTPLTVILGMSDQLSESNLQSDKLDTEKIIQGFSLIRRNGQNLLRLINQLLDLSKLEDNSFKIKFEQGDIVHYLRYITESFQSFADNQQLSLQFHSSTNSLIMDHDKEQVKQVMTNLISNSLKFTPAGGEVIVNVTQKLDQLIIEVKDSGIGIAPADLPYVFDRFYQVDDTTTREGEGTGIGLAHAMELVKLMSGDISAKSKLGKGTVFTVSIPITRRTELIPKVKDRGLSIGPINVPQNDLYSVEENSLKTQNSKLKTLQNLLIIEDNPDVVVYLKSCLENQYQIEVAPNGQIGIDKAIENIPDIIISDVMMPEKDGFQVCDTLKNDERTSHIPIILLTAKADAESKIAGLRRGADAYLSKPFDKEELMVRLEKLAELRQRLQAKYAGVSFDKTPENVSSKSTNKLSDLEDAFIQKVLGIIEENYSDENFALPQLCQEVGMSRSQLFRKMKAVTNTSPSQFIRNYRLTKAKFLLETTNLNVSEVAWQVGYKDLAHFSKSFLSAFGQLPSDSNK